MPVAYWCILIAALLPLVWVSYAKVGARDNSTPRDGAENLAGARRRAYAAHQNAYENFPFFAVAVMAALSFGASPGVVDWLAVLYIAFRVAHGLLYVADRSSSRSMAYAGALLVNIAIFVLPAFK
jgi:uncharacterized MAPEG superfamily protein